ncbi:DUF721 domain-containing protein [Stappia sp. F7233]|uniref:DUF721 domain-containing protein n=1 Tax=Stappia albiluteola TaxID=2758565 RepID=A0A839AHM7_9HYPH|nr:DciA family protein [Stappia albiluteola]MBA5778412.1 DUF721 domain-containing protein [Stappia albiluteola]
MQNQATSHPARRAKARSARPIADLIGPGLSAACRKRGFASADLLTAWPDIVGDRYAEKVQPERLVWPRGRGAGGEDEVLEPAVLTVHTDGATALFLSYELPVVIERINAFFGWAAVGRIKIVQRPITARKRQRPPRLRDLTAEEESELAGKVGAVANPKLRQALEQLGRAVIAKNR